MRKFYCCPAHHNSCWISQNTQVVYAIELPCSVRRYMRDLQMTTDLFVTEHSTSDILKGGNKLQ